MKALETNRRGITSGYRYRPETKNEASHALSECFTFGSVLWLFTSSYLSFHLESI
jgi:hypothetical protein